ncbi:hypothetical protein [Methylocystis parvus]|uniref:Uncharacterized protein n=1 Tax=Methylocystis parvus TaxID=134 RepID=A0A6B8MBC5_9HYPH|nr:hypothetical protein [Methylocystis parvus]QGM98899.1 hypothetical protein F7D14_16355 [Methylocystis parvus]WBK00745.1 hypothetical protein MMG94_03180 [Methylocystis parvus OBBP]
MAEGDFYKDKVVTFIFTSVLAGIVTTSFTYKSWREQTRLDLAKRRLDEAAKSFDRASQLMSARVFHSYRLANGADGDDDAAFGPKLEKYDKVVEDWNIAYPDLLQDFQFALEIDENGRVREFHDINTNSFEEKLDCRRALDSSNGPKEADWTSPTWRLAAMHFCFIATRVKPRALALRQKPPPAAPLVKVSDKAAPPPAENPEIRKKYEALDRDIDDLKTHGEEVRIAGKKAIARLREATETRTFWEFIKSW